MRPPGLCDWWKGWTSDPDRPIRTLPWLAISFPPEVLACYTGSSTLYWYFRFIHPALPPQLHIYNFTHWGFCQMISIGSLNTEVLLQFFLLNPSLPPGNPTLAALPITVHGPELFPIAWNTDAFPSARSHPPKHSPKFLFRELKSSLLSQQG